MLLLHHSHIDLKVSHICVIACGKIIWEDMNSMAEYKCEICNATFNTKGELETHKNKHMTKEVVVAVAVAGSSAIARIRPQHFNFVSNLWLIFYTGRLIRMV